MTRITMIPLIGERKKWEKKFGGEESISDHDHLKFTVPKRH